MASHHSHRHFHKHFSSHTRRLTAPRNDFEHDLPAGHASIEQPSSPVMEARSAKSSCVSTAESDTCQLPSDGGGGNNLAIILGVVLPVVLCIVVCIYLHRRFLARQRMEDSAEAHKSLDFGTEFENRKKARNNGKSVPEMTVTDFEKSVRRGKGMSMDMDMTSPYILPAALKGSRESLHSLSRSMKDDYDPYRPVTMVSEAARYPRVRGDNGSIMTGMTGSSHGTYSTDAINAGLLKNAKRMSQSLPARGDSRSTRNDTQSPSLSRATTVVGSGSVLSKEVLPPPPPPPSKPQPVQQQQGQAPTLALPELETDRDSYFANNAHTFLNNDTYVPPPRSASSRQPQSPPNHAISGDQPTLPQIDVQEPEQQSHLHGQSLHDAHVQAQKEQHSYGLGVEEPDFSQHRLSISMRPLPPDQDPSEDAETRANRIRSFYKEYFDDSKPNKSAGRVPQNPGANDYYEDYGQEYLGDGAVFDPESGQFVVANRPYAAPVTRRAMTPPPRAPPRFRGGPSGHSSSSSVHSHGTFAPPPRGMSAMSGRVHAPQPRKKLPPPKELKSLPTPSMLKDDNILVFDSIDFAPPSSFRDRQAGRRPDSPLGVQRPYSPSVRPFTPLQNSYDDLHVMPSPHTLRNSSTFTGLDFAPPTRLRDIDSGSDVASIRSGRSGLSQAQVYNMRAGAYRISRIPKELTGTKQEIGQSLKPNWDMR